MCQIRTWSLYIGFCEGLAVVDLRTWGLHDSLRISVRKILRMSRIFRLKFIWQICAWSFYIVFFCEGLCVWPTTEFPQGGYNKKQAFRRTHGRIRGEDILEPSSETLLGNKKQKKHTKMTPAKHPNSEVGRRKGRGGAETERLHVNGTRSKVARKRYQMRACAYTISDA